MNWSGNYNTTFYEDTCENELTFMHSQQVAGLNPTLIKKSETKPWWLVENNTTVFLRTVYWNRELQRYQPNSFIVIHPRLNIFCNYFNIFNNKVQSFKPS